jgi:hypothetical protein
MVKSLAYVLVTVVDGTGDVVMTVKRRHLISAVILLLLKVAPVYAAEQDTVQALARRNA